MSRDKPDAGSSAAPYGLRDAPALTLPPPADAALVCCSGRVLQWWSGGMVECFIGGVF